MKIRNKKTGAIYSIEDIDLGNNADGIWLGTTKYDSLAKLNAEWEDVPKEEVWYLGKRIGNYSMPIKEADIVTEKILAWKRLKDKEFRFLGVRKESFNACDGTIKFTVSNIPICIEDLSLLFGGEE